VGHQKLHLVGQDAAVTQNEVFPQAGHVGRKEQRHVRLLRRTVAFAVVAGAAGGDHVHPVVHAVLGKRDDVFACEVGLVKMPTAIGADIAVAGEELAIGQAWTQIKGVDIGHATGADDAVDPDYGLQAGDGIVAAAKDGDLAAGFPAHFACCVIDDRLLKRNPGLREPLGRQLQYFQAIPPDQQRHREKHVTLGDPAAGPKGCRGAASQYTLFQ